MYLYRLIKNYYHNLKQFQFAQLIRRYHFLCSDIIIFGQLTPAYDILTIIS